MFRKIVCHVILNGANGNSRSRIQTSLLDRQRQFKRKTNYENKNKKKFVIFHNLFFSIKN